MKKYITIILALIFVLGLIGCGSTQKRTIKITIPAGSTEAFAYSDEEICPQKDTLKISAGAGIATTEIILKPVDAQKANVYEPVTLKQGDPVKMDVEKGVWFKIGVAIQNPSDSDIVVEIQVENADIRIE